AFEGFKAGDYTFRTENSSQDWAQGYDFQAVEKGWVKRETVPDGNVGTRLSWVFNLDRPRGQDIREREAIGMMFNYDWSKQTLQYGLYDRPVSFWSNTDLAAIGVPGEGELALLKPLVDEGLLAPRSLTEDPKGPVAHDGSDNRPAGAMLGKAGARLEGAGWVVGSDGIRRNAAGEALDLTIIQYRPL